MFSDDMVLQRDIPAAIWGWAEPGEKITVSFDKQIKKTEADAAGRWITWLDPLSADKSPKTLTVTGSTSTQMVNDVVVGEVWLCSGQSNMAVGLAGISNADILIKNATNSLIRYIRVPVLAALIPQDDISSRWVVCRGGLGGSCSAVAYCFALELAGALDVPVGLLTSSVGSTAIEPWTPPDGFRAVPELADMAKEVDGWTPVTEAGRAAYANYIVQLQDWIEAARKTLDRRAMPPSQPVPPGWKELLRDQKTCLYNGMIYPIKPYAFRGVLWYQGENNGGQGLSYYPRMEALIKGWRQAFGREVPFYFVQLAPYGKSNTNNPAGGDGWAAIRQAQTMALAITNTGMACTIDIGDAADMHPRNKLDVGKRLALWALAKTFHRDVVCSGPIYRDFKIEDEKIRINFDYAQNGLMAGEKTGLEPARESKDKILYCFAIAGADKIWHWADAAIEGNTVVVSCNKVPKPVAVRYAYSGNPEGANLYNKEGLPAVPFRTDQWP